jgi:phage/plasmid-like protein (TIGR03299 family)
MRILRLVIRGNRMHNINTYIGRTAAWHALGTVTGKYQTTDELLADRGLQYVVFKSQLHDGLGRPVEAWGTFRWNLADKLAGRKEAAQFLGAVGKDYAVIQHDEGFKSIDAVMRSADGAHYETAGVLGNGERVWALADLGFAAKVGDDVQKGYLLFSTGHDGSMAHSYRLCFTRVVCQNTLGAALSERTKADLTIRHTKNAVARLTDARKALDSMGDDVKRVEDRLNFLAGRKLNREALGSILDRLFPKSRNDDGAERDTTRRSNILADVLKLYELNDGNAFPEQRGTAYNLLNAVTNYTDHLRSSKDDGRAESAMFGSGDALKCKAFDLIYDAARNMETVPRRSASVAVDWDTIGLTLPQAG